MITLYLDMDGVLCDFNTEYERLQPILPDSKKFSHAVLDHRIFENLRSLPDTLDLLLHVATLSKVNVEVLTSVGTFNEDQGYQAKMQKRSWLDKMNIPHKANFVRSKEEKAKYANENTILIDDSEGCINPFVAAGGFGILHTSTQQTIIELNEIFHQIKERNAWRS